MELRGRDARRVGDRPIEVLDQVTGTLTVDDATGVITTADLDGGRTPVPDLPGLSLRGGWGRSLAGRIGPQRTLLHSLLEDLGGAFLVSGYALLREGGIPDDPDRGPEIAEYQADVCIGWARGGEMVTLLSTRGHQAVPYGPAASPTLLDADAWHAVEPTTASTVRRVRRLDVTPSSPGGLAVEAHFRDSYTGDDPEMALHEYLVEADVDAAGALSTIDVDARVLPWASCPGAVASAQGVVGVRIGELAAMAREALRGPTTCTHLTSTIRSLADAGHLADL